MRQYDVALAEGFARLFDDLAGVDKSHHVACQYELGLACEMVADTLERFDHCFDKYRFFKLANYEADYARVSD